MQLQKNNSKKVIGVTLFYIEILLQVFFLIWFCITVLHWVENNIPDRVDLIQSVIKLQYNPTPYPI